MPMIFQKKLSSNPTLTIGIPTLNEENYIGSILKTFLSSKYTGLLEILVCDGGSTDKTREIIASFSEKDERVKLVDNPQKRQVFAFNKMIELAKGELLMIAGAHAEYDKDYITKCIEVHKKTEALNVGGPTRLKAKSFTQLGIVLAWVSRFGNGGAKHRDPNFTGYTDTLFPGCYVTQALREVGGFNTDNITNQDSEINLRVSQLKPNAHYVDSDIYVYYYPRDSFKSLIKQYFRYGRGRFLTSVKHFPNIPIRGYISFLFLWFNILILGLSLSSGFIKEYLIGLTVIILFGFIDLLRTSNVVNRDDESMNSNPSHAFLALLALFNMHFSMGVGFTYQIIKSILTFKLKW